MSSVACGCGNPALAPLVFGDWLVGIVPFVLVAASVAVVAGLVMAWVGMPISARLAARWLDDDESEDDDVSEFFAWSDSDDSGVDSPTEQGGEAGTGRSR